MISSKPDTYALERARNHDIEGVCIARKSFNSIEEYDLALISHLEKHGVDLVVMAGFLSILGETFTKRYEGSIINVHPALIPSFAAKGTMA